VLPVRNKNGYFLCGLEEADDVTSDYFPLPMIGTLDTLSGAKWFSTLDLKIGCWQVVLHPDDKEKTQRSPPVRECGNSPLCPSASSTLRQRSNG
jgi:hypothetical protein